MEMTMITCSYCNGRGFVFVELGEKAQGFPNDLDQVLCEQCNGMGLVQEAD